VLQYHEFTILCYSIINNVCYRLYASIDLNDTIKNKRFESIVTVLLSIFTLTKTDDPDKGMLLVLVQGRTPKCSKQRLAFTKAQGLLCQAGISLVYTIVMLIKKGSFG
jgi:hypothetical protein